MTRGRIDLITPPFKGHLHPILAMCKILVPHYDVCVISSASAQADIQAAGFDSIILESIDDKALINAVNPPHIVGNSPFALRKQFSEILYFFQLLSSEIDTIYKNRNPDLLIADFTLPVAGLIADKYNIPWWTSLPSACVLECQDSPPAYLGGLQPAKSIPGRLKNNIGRKLVRLFKRVIFRLYITDIKALGLNAVYRKDGSEAIYSSQRILCLALQSLEFTKNWPSQVSLIGPMLYSPPSNLDVAPRFLETSKYILVTLGTHLDSQKDRVCAEIERITQKFPHYIFHFSDGHSDGQTVRVVNHQFQRFSYINYQKHLSSYELVVHHGGAGIMYHCLLNQIPSVVYPIDYDQFDHAARLDHNGLSIWLKRITDLEKALMTALNSEELKSKVKEFAVNTKDKLHSSDLLELVNIHMAHCGRTVATMPLLPEPSIGNTTDRDK